MPPVLTAYHHKLIRMRLEGNNLYKIAALEGRSRDTIAYHFTQIYRQLHVNSYTEMIPAYFAYRAARHLQPFDRSLE